MNRPTHEVTLGPRDRIAAFARATETYAETLEDADLANVYWGKALGLRQALAILSADQTPRSDRHRSPAPACGPRRSDPLSPAASTRPVAPQAAGASAGW